MATFRNRFPSTRDFVLVFSACAFPIYVWSILNVLREVPAWMLRLNTWDLVGVIAYTQAFALVESIMILFVLIFLAFALPARFFRDRFVAQGSMIVFLTSAWAVAAQYNNTAIREWSPTMFLIWLVLFLASIGVSWVLIHRYHKLEKSINAFLERLLILSSVYVSLGILGCLIVFLRNV